MSLPFFATWCFSLDTFNSVLITIWCMFFSPYLGVINFSCIWISILFLNWGTFSVKILFENIFIAFRMYLCPLQSLLIDLGLFGELYISWNSPWCLPICSSFLLDCCRCSDILCFLWSILLLRLSMGLSVDLRLFVSSPRDQSFFSISLYWIHFISSPITLLIS